MGPLTGEHRPRIRALARWSARPSLTQFRHRMCIAAFDAMWFVRAFGHTCRALSLIFAMAPGCLAIRSARRRTLGVKTSAGSSSTAGSPRTKRYGYAAHSRSRSCAKRRGPTERSESTINVLMNLPWWAREVEFAAQNAPSSARGALPS
jgi:hypothetical protein